ncbi:TlyA family RNA methyltransferase [Diaminobutyricibacter tongyongensis]|uniref:TlyA family RNA methyltransferase n=1 Tax=Leifsonia tongyongensis TaxID=1268043 RepID=A0A6L9Y1L3_9MICO|nr:TlyA family RNA methyltransferase [Diaminobutyricibacter tongyongensis]NEN07582.1 TlyA family RNA methyltransferase [Diaminobutyricibacter tongyongensis]
MAEARLDVALTERGLARSRSHAAKLIADGLVSVDGQGVVKPSAKVNDDQLIEVAETDQYVSRGAHKLIGALDTFGVPVRGRVAMDVGASTGGFSQVLLERDARLVIAIDVGHGQLSPELAREPRLRSFEGVNARTLTPDALAGLLGEPIRPDLVVGDLSFISLRTVLRALVETAAEGADFVLLVKPQFEVGRTGIREGIVHDPALRADAVANVLWSAQDLGIGTAGIVSSTIVGSQGNHEYLVWLSATKGRNPTEWLDDINAIVGA